MLWGWSQADSEMWKRHLTRAFSLQESLAFSFEKSSDICVGDG